MYCGCGKVKDSANLNEDGGEGVEASDVGAEEGGVDGAVDEDSDSGGHFGEEFDVLARSGR